LAGYLHKLTSLFAEVRRVLRTDGVLWLNIGDGFTSGNRGWRAPDKKNRNRAVKSVVAIEIKGGADKSNIWNRLGEAEKSHQSARQHGFVEFWTIYNVPELDQAKAKEKSPTTTRFYSLTRCQTERTSATDSA